MILYGGWGLLKEASYLMNATPPGIDWRIFSTRLHPSKESKEIHDLHVGIRQGKYALAVHLLARSKCSAGWMNWRTGQGNFAYRFKIDHPILQFRS